MRVWLLSLLLAGLLAAPAAHAAPGDFTGTLTIILGDLATITSTGSGSGSSAGPGGAATIPGGVFDLQFFTPIVPPLVHLYPGIVVGATGLTTNFLPLPTGVLPGHNGALAWAGTTGASGIDGAAYLVGILGSLFGNLAVPIPLGVVGSGGTVTFNVGPITASLIGNPYQLGSFALSGGLLNTANGSIPTPATIMTTGVDNRTALGGGTLNIVAPGSFKLGILGNLPTAAILSLDYEIVPEPGTLFLLGSGVASLVVLSRRRPRK